MKRLFQLAIPIAACFIATITFAAGDLKIGVIDAEKILRDSKGAKKAQELLREDFQSKQGRLTSKEKEIRQAEDELKRIEEKGKPEDVKEKREQLVQLVKDYKRLQSDLEEQFKKDKMEATQKILGEINEVVSSFAKNEKYTLVLEKKQYVWASDATDITDQIIRLYDMKK
jgi:outer membrane protein